MDDPKPVEIQYPGPRRLKEMGIAIDEETVEGGYIAWYGLGVGDIIEIDGDPRRVVAIRRALVMGRPGIEDADATARIRHETP